MFFPLLLLTLAASPQETPAGGLGTAASLGLSGLVRVGLGDRAYLQVDEAADGVDRNGDGDAGDLVGYLYELSTGRAVNLGNAIDPIFDVNDWNGSWLGMVVDESGQGATDLNGDGDTNDQALFVVDVQGMSVGQNLGCVEVRSVRVRENLILFTRSELQDGQTDHNGDGDTGDLVLFVHDASTGLTTNMGFAVASGDSAMDLVGSRVPFLVGEAGQGFTDLNGDGDTGDTVLHDWDPASGLTTNHAVDLDNLSRFGRQATLVYRESENPGDRNGDGDENDNVLQVFDGNTGLLSNVGVAIGNGTTVAGDHGRMAFFADEIQEGQDLNGDGDISFQDIVLFHYDHSTQTASNLGLAGSGLVNAYPWAVLNVIEKSQGGTDLNGDGDPDDTILHALDLLTGEVQDFGLDAALLQAQYASEGLFAFAVDEKGQGETDLNGDGDRRDFVIHVADLLEGTTTNLGLAAFGTGPLFLLSLNRQGSRASFLLDEAGQGGLDSNGDGDAFDRIPTVIDGCTGESAAFPFASTTSIGTAGSHAFENSVVFHVVEQDQGADLNGDGDQDDLVLYAGSLPIAPAAFRPVGPGSAGTGGAVPELGGAGCPTLGTSVGIVLAGGRGGALGALIFGDTEVALDIFGGTLFVFPFEILSVFALDGTAGSVGGGDTLLTFQLTDASLVGTSLILQAGLLDPEAVSGISLSSAVEVRF